VKRAARANPLSIAPDDDRDEMSCTLWNARFHCFAMSNVESPLLSLPQLPRRVTAAREQSGLTQAALAQKLAFNDRQTLAAIEAGQRRLTAEELLALMTATGVEMEFFTDPFRLIGEGAFSYRASGFDEKKVNAFEEKARSWIAAWRYLGERKGERSKALRPRLAIRQGSTFEEAQIAGEDVGRELKLGGVPAEKLASAIEQQFGLLVLHVEMPPGISGAACQVGNGEVIFVNRNEASVRRNFDLAHELFHVLTWDALPPERVDRESPTSYKQKRVEHFADNFAGALLMPANLLKPLWDRRTSAPSLGEWIAAAAAHFGVSTSALRWRLVALDWMTKTEAEATKEPKNSSFGKTVAPAAFSRRFLEQIAWGIDHGEISARKAAEILGVQVTDLQPLFAAQGVALIIGL
jgi:Zn-dependent peptidase ImmA (M78 family)/transcriptional regulator with XRE-family HTH domain